jgi:hypothetical protein
MEATLLTNKELKDQELIEIHLALFTKFVKEKIHSLRNRNIAIAFYQAKITTDNIRLYYNRRINIFAQALLTDDLKSIEKHSTHSK